LLWKKQKKASVRADDNDKEDEKELGERMVMKVYLMPSSHQRALRIVWIDAADAAHQASHSSIRNADLL